jgi:hypothetical protein
MGMGAEVSGERAPRVAGVDVARALASLIMIQGHAYHGWVAPEHRGELAYRFTRLLGTLPLPAFLVLAGASLALAVRGAAERGLPAADLKHRLTRRGLEIVGIGYAVSLAYGLLDGAESLDTFLRSDVLHVIGLSIAVVAFVGIRGDDAGVTSPRKLLSSAIIVGLVTTLASPLVQPLGVSAPGSLRYPIALFVDVPGVTRMPLFPLAGWFCLGVGATFALEASRARGHGAAARFAAVAGASPRFLACLALGALVVALGAYAATGWAAARIDAPLTRAHPAIVLNVIDLGARGLLVLAVGAALSVALSEKTRRVVAWLGQGTLVAYVVHVPFCYGRLGAPLVGKLDMTTATLALIPLATLSFGAIWLRDRFRAQSSRRGRIPLRSTAPRANL